MRTEMNYPTRRALRRVFALLLAGVLCMPLAAVSAAAATPMAGIDNTIALWNWTRVDSQADLPTDTPKDHLGQSYNYRVMFLFEENDTRYMVDGSSRNGAADNFKLRGVELPQGVLYGEKSFRTVKPVSNMWMQYAGVDEGNASAKQYYLHASSAPRGLFGNNDGFIEDAVSRSKWTMFTPDSGVSRGVDVSQSRIKCFVNVPRASDTQMNINKGQLRCYTSSSWSMSEMVMYVGRQETWSAITHPITVKSGQVQNIDGYVYVEPNAGITVEPGGVLSIQGTLYNNGYIYNQGDVLLQKDASIETFRLEGGSGGVICCDGGDLILLSGARIAPGWCSYDATYGNGFVLRNGATCTNFGTIVLQNNAYLESGAALDNRETGTVMFGYKLWWREDGNLNTFSQNKLTSVASYEGVFTYLPPLDIVVGKLYTMHWGEDTLLYNRGKVYMGGWARATSNQVAYAGNGTTIFRLYVETYAQKYLIIKEWPAAWPRG